MSVLGRERMIGFKSQRCVSIAWLTASVSCVGISVAAEAQTRDSRKAERAIEEVIVSAQRRVERLEDVPISISVLGGEELDKSTAEGVSETLGQVAGVKMTQGYQGGGTQLSVRGVAASGPFYVGGGTVGYYMDSVPFGFVKSAILPDPNAYDLERVEVLRGPQGTLYGASALNGVVRVLTRDADLEKFELKTRASFATTEQGGDSYRSDLAVNVPLIDGKLGARLVAGYNEMGGWIDKPTEKDTNNSNVSNVRLKVNARPTDNLSLGLSAWRSRTHDDSPPVANDEDMFFGTLNQATQTDFDVVGLKIGYDLPSLSIASMTSYIDFSNHGNVDFSNFGLGVLFSGLDSKVFSQEVTLSSNQDESWHWSLGGFYRDAEDHLLQRLDILPAPLDFTDKSESFAIFGELTRLFMGGKIEVTAGLRYFEDDVSQIENSPTSGDPTQPLVDVTRTFDTVSPRVVLSWHPTEDSTVYASYSEGFRSGYNQSPIVISSAPNFPAAKEDTLTNYEIGAKGSFAGGRVTYDTAVYYIDWKDVQQTLNVFVNSVPFLVGINGDKVSGPGVDVALGIQPADNLQLGLTYSWNDLQHDSPVFSNGVLLFEKGARPNYSSEYTAGGSLGYSFPVGDRGLECSLSAAANYSSPLPNRTVIGPSVLASDGDGIWDSRASIGLGSPDHWTATLFVDNVNDERAAPVRTATDIYNSRTRPRTMGLQVEYSFR